MISILGITPESLVLLVVAVLTGVNTYYSRKTEKNTNSIKDELVATTSKLADMEGHARGLAQGREENKTV